MTNDHKRLIAEARMFAEARGERRDTAIVSRLADALESASVERAVVDREALARQMFIADNWGVKDPARLWDELLAHPAEFERYRKRADGVVASGLLADRAVVEAQALEQAAKVAQDRADDLRACHKNDDCDVVAHGAQVVADDLRDRARIVREGQA